MECRQCHHPFLNPEGWVVDIVHLNQVIKKYPHYKLSVKPLYN